MNFGDEDLKALLDVSGNEFLSECPENKYDRFKDKDPFPEINSALLNSEDIIKYILTTGMVYPFVPKNLQGATYACTFSGTYLKYNIEGQEETKTLSDDEQLFIEPNSITYLEINEKFMVPLYMVLRFNLKVPHVYKGLLLGTGPIVDPGFVGKLYIPLHNLTLNKYVIKKGAELISVEFTKLNIKKEWADLNLYRKVLVSHLNFSCLSKDIQKKIKPDRNVREYLIKSLQEDELFYKEPKNNLSVGSSLANYVKQLETIRESVTSDIKNNECLISCSISGFKEESKEINERINSSLKKTEEMQKKIDRGVWIGLGGVIVAVAALVYPTWQTFYDIGKDRDEYRDELNVFQEKISNLENSVAELIIENKKEHINLLKEEYDLFVNKRDTRAISIYNQITELEEEISELQKQLH